MHTDTATFEVASNDLQEQERQYGGSRFGAIVESLRQLSSPRSERRSVAGEFDEALPTRRINRARRLLGKLPKPGKSRSHARRFR